MLCLAHVCVLIFYLCSPSFVFTRLLPHPHSLFPLAANGWPGTQKMAASEPAGL